MLRHSVTGGEGKTVSSMRRCFKKLCILGAPRTAARPAEQQPGEQPCAPRARGRLRRPLSHKPLKLSAALPQPPAAMRLARPQGRHHAQHSLCQGQCPCHVAAASTFCVPGKATSDGSRCIMHRETYTTLPPGAW